MEHDEQARDFTGRNRYRSAGCRDPVNAYSRIEYREEGEMTIRPEYDLKIVGQNLKRLRKAKNLTVKNVRDYLCLGSVQAIYKFESGKGYPQTDTMFALMELYDASLYDITRKQGEDTGSSPVVSGFKQLRIVA